MGTRADFYIGNPEQNPEWIGSIAYDGYPCGVPGHLLISVNQEVYRELFRRFCDGRDDVTLPEQGWPWPWKNSQTTDYAYCLFDGKVHAYSFGHGPFNPLGSYEENYEMSLPLRKFPNMAAVRRVTWGRRSGLMVIE